MTTTTPDTDRPADSGVDVLGILGADPDVRNGFERVTARFAIDADAAREDLEALLAQSQKRSAVFDVVTTRPTLPSSWPERCGPPPWSSEPGTPAWP